MHKLIVCLACEAEFNLKHDMGEDYYKIKFCPFCGEELEDHEEYEFEEDEDEEYDYDQGIAP
jgi:rRNA maturation endonuclease Nob1